ncbi:MAG: hypothetical protein C5B51_28600 [Terriglobia bacterium]|nr:MAG: hypothetical protein C5B51_28600 [Terriglobia bacterium]
MLSKLAAVSAGLGIVAALATAQVTGRISGSIVDSSGAAVPDAQVQLLLPAGKTAIFLTATTGEGLFRFAGIQPGKYDIKIEAKGFLPASVREVEVDPIRETSLPAIQIALATVTQSIEVVSAVQPVETANAEVSSTVTSPQIDKLPLLDRTVIDIAQTQAGVVNASPISNGTDVVVNGLRSTYLNVTLDGINIQDNYLRENSGDFTPNRLRVSQVSEMTVGTSNVSSTVGGGAAQFNMVSPSGTNQFHGEALWYNRNNALAANEWFNNQSGVDKPFLNENIFGGSFGGPIRKDKLFFYGTYEGTRVRQQTAQNGTVLTPDARNGIFTYTTSAGVVQKVNLLNLRGVQIDPFVQSNILSGLPGTVNNFRVGDSSARLLRNTAGYTFNQRNNGTQDNAGAKVDYNLSPRHAFTGAFHLVREFQDRPDTFGTYGGFTQVPPVFNDEKVKLYSGSWRWSPRANLTNELRGGANVAPAIFAVSGKPPAFFELNSSVLWTTPVNEFLPQGRTPTTYTIGDTAGYTRGRHSLQFGGNFQLIRIYTYGDGGIVPGYGVGMGTGQLALTTADLPGIGSADLVNANALLAGLGGFVNTYTQTFNVTSRTSGFVNGATNARNWAYNNYAAYVQDQWKVMPRLTLSLGLRYDYFSPVDEVNGLILMPVVQGGVINTLLSNATLDFAGGGSGRPLYNKDRNNFAPNVAFAWDVSGNGKTAVRGGYSINYVDDNNIATAQNNGQTNSGLQSVVGASGLSGRLSSNRPAIPTPTFQIPTTEANNYKLNPSGNAMGLIDPNLRTPYVQQWNFSIEHDFKGTLFTVRYLGNHGVKELRALDFNQVNINANGFLADFNRARNNGNLARQATGVFNPDYNPNIAGSQPLTVFPQLVGGGLLTNGTIRTYIDQGQIGTLASTYQTNGLNGPVNFFNNPLILGANLITNFSNSTYNAFQVEVRHRYRRGLQIQANYTFSKVLSDALGDTQTRFEPLLDNQNGKLERSRAPYDISHAFHANGSYELPFGAGRKWLSRGPVVTRLAGGWTISSLVTWQSGAPFSIVSTRGTLNRGGNRSAENTASSSLTKSQLDKVVGFYMTGNGPFFINPANLNTDGRGTTQEGAAVFANQAFYNPGPGTVGNLQRRLFNNPPVFGMDASIQKVTRITERQSVELRMDAINVFNHPTFFAGDSYNGGSPAARFNVNQTSFGRIGFTFFDRRVLQLGLRYRF